jgi:cytochrome c oxidase subunit 2
MYLLFDSSSFWQLYFQDAATPVMKGIIDLHHDLMFFIVFIFFFVSVILGRTLIYYGSATNENKIARSVVHGTTIEII